MHVPEKANNEHNSYCYSIKDLTLQKDLFQMHEYSAPSIIQLPWDQGMLDNQTFV